MNQSISLLILSLYKTVSCYIPRRLIVVESWLELTVTLNDSSLFELVRQSLRSALIFTICDTDLLILSVRNC